MTRVTATSRTNQYERRSLRATFGHSLCGRRGGGGAERTTSPTATRYASGRWTESFASHSRSRYHTTCSATTTARNRTTNSQTRNLRETTARWTPAVCKWSRADAAKDGRTAAARFSDRSRTITQTRTYAAIRCRFAMRTTTRNSGNGDSRSHWTTATRSGCSLQTSQ